MSKRLSLKQKELYKKPHNNLFMKSRALLHYALHSVHKSDHVHVPINPLADQVYADHTMQVLQQTPSGCEYAEPEEDLEISDAALQVPMMATIHNLGPYVAPFTRPGSTAHVHIAYESFTHTLWKSILTANIKHVHLVLLGMLSLQPVTMLEFVLMRVWVFFLWEEIGVELVPVLMYSTAQMGTHLSWPVR